MPEGLSEDMPDTYGSQNVKRYGTYQVAFLLMSLGNCISTQRYLIWIQQDAASM
jgi:hypothetical protein